MRWRNEVFPGRENRPMHTTYFGVYELIKYSYTKEKFGKVCERAYKLGYDNGHDDGYEEGHKDGFNE